MRTAAAAFFVVLGLVAWVVGVLAFALVTGFIWLGNRYSPPGRSNCWIFALDKWRTHGGYLLVRRSDKTWFLGRFAIPHVIWVKSLPAEGVDLEQFQPEDAKPLRWFPYEAVWFKGHVETTEAPHPAAL